MYYCLEFFIVLSAYIASCVRLLLMYRYLVYDSFLCTCLDDVHYNFANNTVLFCTISFRIYFCFVHVFVSYISLFRTYLRILLTFILYRQFNYICVYSFCIIVSGLLFVRVSICVYIYIYICFRRMYFWFVSFVMFR